MTYRLSELEAAEFSNLAASILEKLQSNNLSPEIIALTAVANNPESEFVEDAQALGYLVRYMQLLKDLAASLPAETLDWCTRTPYAQLTLHDDVLSLGVGFVVLADGRTDPEMEVAFLSILGHTATGWTFSGVLLNTLASVVNQETPFSDIDLMGDEDDFE